MTTRREFLQAGIAASTVPVVGHVFDPRETATPFVTASSTEAPPAAAVFYKAVFDTRFPDSVAFGAEMERLGVVAHAIAGDITDFWYHDLRDSWKETPRAIAGLTAHGPLFCLERLAWDHGMRVIFRAEHQYRSDACVDHVVSAPEALLQHVQDLAAAGEDWSAQMARIISRCSHGRVPTSEVVVTQRASASRVEREPLYSWVIAPVVRG